MILIAIASVTVICMSFVKSAQITTNNIFTPMLENSDEDFIKFKAAFQYSKANVLSTTKAQWQ